MSWRPVTGLEEYWECSDEGQIRLKRKAEPELAPIPNCSCCGSKLSRESWNSTGDILVCWNHKCGNFAQPKGWIKVENKHFGRYYHDNFGKDSYTD